LKYDYLVLLKKGIKMDGIAFDTMLAAYILNPGKRNYDLDNLSFIELGYEKITIESLIGVGKKQKKLSDVPLKDVAQYSCEDADMTFRLYKLLNKRLSGKLREVYFSIELPLISVLAKMEAVGVKVDEARLERMSRDFSRRIEVLRQKIYRISGSEFNINSTQQLRQVLFEKLKIDTKDIRKTKTGLSTAAAELQKLKERHKIIDLIFRYREINKLKNTYLDALPRLVDKKSRIHTSFNQTITTTGRLSSSVPNLQNIPVRSVLGNRIRQAFVAKSGCTLLAFDYSQIELRVVAHLAEDKKMTSAFKKNEDIHAATAAWLFHKPIKKISPEERREAKTVNFGVLYGMSSYGLSQGMGVGRECAAEFIENYFGTFSGLRNYLSKTKDFARKYGYVETLTGRRRYIPEISSAVFEIASGAERMAINMPVQGTAADIIKLAMIQIQDKIINKHNDIGLTLQVHDELVFEAKKNKISFFATKIKKIMEEAFKLSVPIKVDVSRGSSWGNLKKLE
jgi:DNA polymerase-1